MLPCRHAHSHPCVVSVICQVLKDVSAEMQIWHRQRDHTWMMFQARVEMLASMKRHALHDASSAKWNICRL